MDRKHYTYNHPIHSGHRSFAGEIVVGLYLGIWISSLLSPILLGIALYGRNWIAAMVIMTLTAIAYLPEGWVPASTTVRRLLLRGMCAYWESCSMQWAAGSAPAGTRGAPGRRPPVQIL